MKSRRSNRYSPVIIVKNLQKGLRFNTETLSLQASEKLTPDDETLVPVSVGFDSPLLILSPVEYVRKPLTKEELAKNKLGVGVQFHLGINGSNELDEFFTDVITKGITVISDSNNPHEMY